MRQHEERQGLSGENKTGEKGGMNETIGYKKKRGGLVWKLSCLRHPAIRYSRVVLVQGDEMSSLVFVLGYSRMTEVEPLQGKPAPFVSVSLIRLQQKCDLDFTNSTLE